MTFRIEVYKCLNMQVSLNKVYNMLLLVIYVPICVVWNATHSWYIIQTDYVFVSS